jgi:hypothetical protein
VSRGEVPKGGIAGPGMIEWRRAESEQPARTRAGGRFARLLRGQR